MRDLEPTDNEAASQSIGGHGAQPNGSAGSKTEKVRLWARICLWAGLVVVAFGFARGFGIEILQEPLELFPPEMELPLGRLDTIAVDKEGNIYCHSRFSDRIQIYAPDGRFIRGFNVQLSTFRIDGNENIRGYAGGEVLTYNLEGELLKKEPYDREVHGEEFYDTFERDVTDASGNLYRIMPFPTISSRVEKITPEGKRTVVMSQPLYLRLVQAPFPVFVYIFLGFCLIWTYLIVKHLHNKKRKQQRKSQGRRVT